jgi:hypothetical protein
LVRYIAEDEEEFFTLQDAPPRAYLTLLVEGRISHSFPLRNEVQLGREKSNAVVVADQKVSRHHASLAPLDNTFIVSDQGSANGTYVNGVRIAQPTRLNEKDKITLGDTTFLFTANQPDANFVDQPSPAPLILPPQSIAQGLAPALLESNMPVWALIGCMALAIVALLFAIAMLLGMFVGINQAGAVILGLAGL